MTTFKTVLSCLFLGLSLTAGCGAEEATTDDTATEAAELTAVKGTLTVTEIAGGARFALAQPGQPAFSVELTKTRTGAGRARVTVGGRSITIDGTGARARAALASLPGGDAGVQAVTIQLGTGYCNRYNGSYQAHWAACDLWDWFWS